MNANRGRFSFLINFRNNFLFSIYNTGRHFSVAYSEGSKALHLVAVVFRFQ